MTLLLLIGAIVACAIAILVVGNLACHAHDKWLARKPDRPPAQYLESDWTWPEK